MASSVNSEIAGPAEPEQLLAGRYRLHAIIGRGGMGSVWRARDEVLHRDVAVKEIIWPAHMDPAERETARRRALREAQMAARLNHPNVVGIYDIVQEDGRPWIVMELAPYRSLQDVVREDGPLTPARAAQVGLGILAALRAAHNAGVLHRDVKPGNVLLGPGGRVVLTDFGIARADGSAALTTSGVLVGSPSYISPERARGGQAGTAGDLWGLGASLYAAVEGRPPFDREGALASLTAVVTDEPDPSTRTGPLQPVISGLLRKDPAVRLGADEVEWMLRRVADGQGPVPDRDTAEFDLAAVQDLAAEPDAAAERDAAVDAAAADAAAAARHAPAELPRPREPDLPWPRTPAPPRPREPEPPWLVPPAPAERPASQAERPPSQAERPASQAERPASQAEPASSEPAPPSKLTSSSEPAPASEPAPVPFPQAGSASLQPEAASSHPEAASPQPEPTSHPEPTSPKPEAASSHAEPASPEPEAASPQPEVASLQPEAAPPPAVPPSPGPPVPHAGRDGRRRRAPVLVGALAAAAVIAAVALVITLAPGSSPGRRPAAAPSHGASAPATRSAPPSPAGSPSASASAPASGGGTSLPPGYYRFTNSTGFSIGVPAGWQISHVGQYVYIEDPSNPAVYLLIDQSDTPKPNPLADWEQQAANRQGTYPDYHLIRLQSVRYPQAEKAADWEFTYDKNGQAVRVLNRNVLANADHAYALYWTTPVSAWATDYHYFQAFAGTFQPAPVSQSG